ncbi:MAG: magnesium transporter [Phycisphaerae bacterium]|jgi:magnesium transporter|nr:magnesium transporter [Phycisphaerae bacterium]
MSAAEIQPRIEQLIEVKDFATLKSVIAQMEVHELTDLLTELEGAELAMVFRLLPSEDAADIFGDLPLELQEELLNTLSSEKVADILNDMPPDERTELLEELPGQLAQRLLTSLRGEELQIARQLLNYPEESIGRLMTPEYMAIGPDWMISDVFAHMRKVGEGKETFNIVYVVDEESKLIDEVSLEQLVLAEPDETVRDLMDGHVAHLQASEDQEEAIDEFKKYEAVALPVVNSQGILVGIVTHDDVLDVQEEEDTEDFQRVTGMDPLEYSYFGTSFLDMIRKRLPWLAMLLVVQTLATLTLANFNSMQLFAILVIFMPLINSPAGNTGSQMAGLMIRGLAVAEIELADWRKVLKRELLRGLALGLVLAVIGFGAAYLIAPLAGSDEATVKVPQIALAVSLAITLAVTMANIIGSMLPFAFKRVGLDPAVTSGPFIASIMDVSAIVVYFSIATAILHITV